MTHPFEVYLNNVTGSAKLLPPSFAPRLAAPHPPAHCLCTWTWTPSIGGRNKPFAMKYWNRACPVRHFPVT